MLSFNKQTARCGKCEQEVKHVLVSFRSSFLNAFSGGLINDSQWEGLVNYVKSYGIHPSEALTFIRGDGLHFLERSLTYFYADGEIDDTEDQYVRTLIILLEIPDNLARPLLQRLAYLKQLTSIRQGHLPRITPSIHLDSGELCYLEVPATYNKVNAKSISRVPGRLIATNKKLQFLSASGGADIPLKRIARVDRKPNGVYLELSTKKGNGFYNVDDPMLAEAIIDTLARMDKRQLLSPQSDAASRHIPHAVRQAVWQRDQGKCVQCSAIEYLEYDHIIPFSKGGASTVNNVQLLCRKCNLAKGSRL
jgi:HNH endonuclease